MRFFHMGDLHLDCLQYGSEERRADFTKAAEAAFAHALQSGVSLILIAGDMFHKQTVRPDTMFSVVRMLEGAKAQGVEVVAVPGNHDRILPSGSWLNYLEGVGLLHVLDTTWGMFGGYHVAGVAYSGQLEEDIENFLYYYERREPDAFSIFVTHGAIENLVPGMVQDISVDMLARLSEAYDYVAVGHYHGVFNVLDNVHSSGSLERVATNEGKGRGYVVDTEGHLFSTVQAVCFHHRPFVVFSVDVTHAASGAEVLEVVIQRVSQEMQEVQSGTVLPVVDVALTGKLGFARAALDIRNMESALVRAGALLARVHVKVENGIAGRGVKELPRETIERDVLAAAFAADARWQHDHERLARWAMELRQGALAGVSDAELVASVRKAAGGK